MSTIQMHNFIFNGISSEEFGVMMCTFSTSSPSSSNDEETEIITVKTYGSDIFHLVNTNYSNPLKFPITLCNTDGTFIDAYKQRELKKWLCRTDGYHWLSVDQDDLYNIRYKCIMSFSDMEHIGRMNGGMYFNVQCDSPFAYTTEQRKTYTCSSDTLNFIFNYSSDFDKSDKPYYPSLVITSAITGTIRITNNTTNEYIQFTNCTNGEIITISDDGTPTSSINRVIIDYWNYGDLYFVNGSNSITISGNCTLKIIYSYPIRVGG
jgi:phage-related protein